MRTFSEELAALFAQNGPGGLPRYGEDEVRAALLAVVVAGGLFRRPAPAGAPELLAWFGARSGLGPQTSPGKFLAALQRFVEQTLPAPLRREVGELFRRRSVQLERALDLRLASEAARKLRGESATAAEPIPQKDIW